MIVGTIVDFSCSLTPYSFITHFFIYLFFLSKVYLVEHLCCCEPCFKLSRKANNVYSLPSFLECIGLNGRDRRTVIKGPKYPFGLTLHGHHFFYTDWEEWVSMSLARRIYVRGLTILLKNVCLFSTLSFSLSESFTGKMY